MKKFITLIFLLIPISVGATDFEYYFADGGSGTTCSEVSPCAGSYAQTKHDSFSSAGNTLTLYFNRGDTFTMSSNTFLDIDKSNVFIDAYGSGDKPIISGNYTYPNDKNIAMISVGDSTGSSITNVHISNIRFINSSNGISTAERGAAIRFSGTGAANGYFTGPGSVKNCEFKNIGWAAINIYRVPNSGGASTDIEIENNLIEDVNLYPKANSWSSGWPQAINTNDDYTYGHTCRYNVIDGVYGEGIGGAGFSDVSYNIVSNTKAPGIYTAWDYGTAHSVSMMFNLVYGSTTDSYGRSEGIKISDEGSSGENGSATILIYNNIVSGRTRGIALHPVSGVDNFGPVRIFHNLLIDNDYNFYFNRDVWSDVEVKNNALIINSDSESACNHFLSYNISTWTEWDIGPNFFDGDTTPAPPMDTEAVGPGGVSSDLLKTSGWRTSPSTSLSDMTPQTGSDMLNNSSADTTLGSPYNTLINGGTWDNLPGTFDMTTANQSSPWTFGAVGESGSVTPTISGLGTVGAVACNEDPETVSQVCQTNVPATCKWDPTDTDYDSMANTYDTTDNLSFSDTFAADCGDSGTHYTICRNLYDSEAESASSSNAWSVNAPPFPGTPGGGGLIQVGTGGTVNIKMSSGTVNITLER